MCDWCSGFPAAGPARFSFWDQRGLGVARLLRPEEFLEQYGSHYAAQSAAGAASYSESATGVASYNESATGVASYNAMGPDALGITCDELRARLGGSRRAIKVALLDQHALAGVGNLYASEILHRAGIHPATPCHRLRGSDWPKLHAALGEILQAAIRHQGSTLRDGTYRIARNNPAAYQFFHRVYQRAGELCLECRRARIVRIVQAQRSTFFCPACQRRGHVGRIS